MYDTWIGLSMCHERMESARYLIFLQPFPSWKGDMIFVKEDPLLIMEESLHQIHIEVVVMRDEDEDLQLHLPPLVTILLLLLL